MAKKKTSIKDWEKDDQPREKLLSKNPQSLSDSELLAILIRCGTPPSAKAEPAKSAITLAQEVLELGGNNLRELGKLSVRDLTAIRGIGQVKAITLVAALELGRRRESALHRQKLMAKDSRQVVSFIQPLLRDRNYEVFGVLYLNTGGTIKHFEIVSQGGITSTVADPRLILKRALEKEAVSLILCHNHPSGNARPSRADEELTAKIKEGARYLDIVLLDHIIIGEEGYFSFADAGKL